MAEQYYYKQLNRSQQIAYHNILEGTLAILPSFQIPKLSMEELSIVFTLLRLDHPEVFWLSDFKCRFYQQADSFEFIPGYLFKKKQIKFHRDAMNSRIERLCREASGKTDVEKLQYVHDFICSSITYDKLKRQYAHEIIGPLGQGVGVCEGIAKAVKVLCDRLSVWCIVAMSDNNPEKGIKYRHTWNIIRLNGKYYHLDATFDNTLGKENGIRYDYFNLCDKAVYRDHEPSIWKVPECSDNTAFWYRDKKLSFTKAEDVYRRAEQALKKGKVFTYHWRGGYLTRELLIEMVNTMNTSANEKGKHIILSVNWAQAVIRVTFVDSRPEASLILQDADESDQ